MTDKVTSEKNKTTRRIKKTVLKLWKIISLIALTFQQIYCIILKDKDSIFFGSRRRECRKERNINCGWTLKWFGHIAINQAEHKLQNIKQN